jgi:aliphatic nitrilase
MVDNYSKLKVAAVQAAPIFLDRKATVKKACDLIREAGENGAKIIVFPEGFIPTHPVWFLFHSVTDNLSTELSVELFKNSIEVPSSEVDEICDAAKDANAYVIMGICEKIAGTVGTMYNTQIYLGPDGEYIGKHQKIMPTAGERIVHKGGNGDTFGAINTEYGPISALMCSENSNPLAVFALTAEGTRIHAMSWPNFWRVTGNPMRKYVKIASLNFAQVSKAYVISACSTVNEDMLERMNLNEQQKEILRKPEMTGGTMIIAPNTDIIAGPMGNEEGILYADIDIEQCIKYKLHHDFSGHYNREDIFRLCINKANPQLYYKIDGSNALFGVSEAGTIQKENDTEEETSTKAE